MKLTRIIPVCFVTCLTAAAATVALAADAEKARNEHGRFTITSAGPAAPADKPAEPVTFIGLEVAPASDALAAQLRLPEGQGLVVNFVVPDSPAAKAGLQKHDVLTRFDDQILIDPRQLAVLVRGHKEADKINITYLRAGAEARVAVSLETHLASDMSYQWTRTAPSPVFFAQRVFSAGADDGDEVHEFHAQPFEPGARIDTSRGLARALPGTAAVGGPLVTIFRPSAKVIFADDAGTLEVRMDDGNRLLTAKDPKGVVIFSGPVSAPEQRAALPEDVRKRLEKLEAMGAFENLESPPPPPPGPAPAATTGAAGDAPLARPGRPAATMIERRSMAL